MNRVMSIVIYFLKKWKKDKKLQGLVHIGKTNASDIILMNTLIFQSECGFLCLFSKEKLRKPELDESLEVILFLTPKIVDSKCP